MSRISEGLLSVSETLENSYNFKNIGGLGGLECKDRRLKENFTLGHQSNGIFSTGKKAVIVMRFIKKLF